jgi:hypothetical protein
VFSGSQDKTFSLPLLPHTDAMSLLADYRRESTIAVTVRAPLIFQSEEQFFHAIVAAGSGNPRLVYLTWELVIAEGNGLGAIGYINFQNCFGVNTCLKAKIQRQILWVQSCTGRLAGKTNDLAVRSRNGDSNPHVEQLIAGGVYCANYDHKVSMVTPYMSQIALHAYVLFILEVSVNKLRLKIYSSRNC